MTCRCPWHHGHGALVGAADSMCWRGQSTSDWSAWFQKSTSGVSVASESPKNTKTYLQCFGGGNFFASEGFGFFWIRWKFQPWLLWYYARGKGQWLNDVESRANRKKGWGMQAMSQIFLGASNQNSSSLKDSLHIVGWPSVNPDELFCLLKGPDGDVSFPPFWATQKLGHARTFGLDSPRPLMA